MLQLTARSPQADTNMELTTQDIFSTEATTTERDLSVDEIYEGPNAKVIGTAMMGISFTLLILLFLCDLPKLYRDVTGKSFKIKRLKGPKKGAGAGAGEANAKQGGSGTGKPAGSTPVQAFQGVDSESDDNWDEEKRPGSSCQRPISKQEQEEARKKQEDDLLIQL